MPVNKEDKTKLQDRLQVRTKESEQGRSKSAEKYEGKKQT